MSPRTLDHEDGLATEAPSAAAPQVAPVPSPLAGLSNQSLARMLGAHRSRGPTGPTILSRKETAAGQTAGAQSPAGPVELVADPGEQEVLSDEETDEGIDDSAAEGPESDVEDRNAEKAGATPDEAGDRDREAEEEQGAQLARSKEDDRPTATAAKRPRGGRTRRKHVRYKFKIRANLGIVHPHLATATLEGSFRYNRTVRRVAVDTRTASFHIKRQGKAIAAGIDIDPVGGPTRRYEERGGSPRGAVRLDHKFKVEGSWPAPGPIPGEIPIANTLGFVFVLMRYDGAWRGGARHID